MRSFTSTKQTLEQIAEAIAPAETSNLALQERQVWEIIQTVRERGDAAICEYIERFDGAHLTPATLQVTEAEFAAARTRASRAFMKALHDAAGNIRRFHEKQRPADWFDLERAGNVVGEKFTPIERVGIHIPGATAPLPSSVLMTVIPAQVAGVREIHLATPPNREGRVNPAILAAIDYLGVRSVFKMAGAQAVAAFAYGTATVPKVHKIIGPGNIYATLAKKFVFGTVGIDGLYGPSEVVVIANGEADAAWVAADLLAQCEHRFDSCAVLISPSRALLANVKSEIEKQVRRLPTKANAWRSWTERGALVQTRSIAEAITLSNLIAPEHLELHLDNALALLGDVKNAGCVLLGTYSPAAISDYLAGPSHCLPTGRTATFSSGLGVMDFMKHSGVVAISKSCLADFAENLREFTAVEGLEAHHRAVQQRLRRIAARKAK